LAIVRLETENTSLRDAQQQREVDDAARKSALVVQHDSHKRIAQTNEKLRLALQRQVTHHRDVRRGTGCAAKVEPASSDAREC
jgi:hypothetical protein